MKDKLNCFYNSGGDAYLLESVAIHFNHTGYVTSTIFTNRSLYVL